MVLLAKKIVIGVALAVGFGFGACSPVTASATKNVKVIERSPISIFSKMGGKQFLYGAVSGLAKTLLCIYLNNKLVLTNKAITFPLSYAALTALETFLLRKWSKDPQGLPLSSLFTSNLISLTLLRFAFTQKPDEGFNRFVAKLFDPIFGFVGWIFSGASVPNVPAPTGAPAIPAPMIPTVQLTK
jgi:hypothetical protein